MHAGQVDSPPDLHRANPDPHTACTILEREFSYYKRHQAELFKEHPYKFLVIKDEKVIGVHDSHDDAL